MLVAHLGKSALKYVYVLELRMEVMKEALIGKKKKRVSGGGEGELRFNNNYFKTQPDTPCVTVIT